MEIKPPVLFKELRRGVLGQDKALRFVAVSIYKHITGAVPGKFLEFGRG